MLLTGVGPLIAWRRVRFESLKRAFCGRVSRAWLVVVLAIDRRACASLFALMSFGLCFFVTATIVLEFWKGAHAIAPRMDRIIPAVIELTHRNTRRYGGYLVHMGIVFMFIGYTGPIGRE
jgi:cytochrome c-type biogenesis protein CcmF